MINSEKGKVKECLIHDYPKFLWRGMHLDCARQFYSVRQIKKLLSVLNSKLLTIAPTSHFNELAASFAVLAVVSKTNTLS